MEDLIEAVRQHDVIYDTTSKKYKDRFVRTAVWEEIGEKLNQPAEKCKDDWDKLRNAYTNALKRRKKSKKSGQSILATPWKYEEQMRFIQPFIKSRPTKHVTPSESPERFQSKSETSGTLSPEHQEDRPLTPFSDTSSHSQNLNLPNTQNQDYFNFSHSKRYHMEQDMDETDLFFRSMSKALKRLPSLDQIKIKLDLHNAISQAEIRKLQREDTNVRAIGIAHEIISESKQET